MAGSASTVRRFLLVECAGPWGREALRDSRLPTDVASWLRTTTQELGIRTLLIRRPGRQTEPGTTVFVASVRPQEVWLERIRLGGPEDLPGLDLSPLGAGRSPGFDPYTEPLFLVCTHGRHDACCAERGRPVAAELALVEPDATWEVSHIGGDRFAGNVLVLPDGLYYGRLEPEGAVAMAAAHRTGSLALPYLRGRTCYPFDVQAAEIHLRNRLRMSGGDDLVWLSRERDGELFRVSFDVTGLGVWNVVVRRGVAASTQLTCKALKESSAPTFELVDAQESEERTAGLDGQDRLPY